MKNWKIATAGILTIYFFGYIVVRNTHEKQWFDKTTEETGSYSFFNSLSTFDSFLHLIYLPFLELDLKTMNRPYEKDKW